MTYKFVLQIFKLVKFSFFWPFFIAHLCFYKYHNKIPEFELDQGFLNRVKVYSKPQFILVLLSYFPPIFFSLRMFKKSSSLIFSNL